MGPGVFYSWNNGACCSFPSLSLSFNGARSFLLLEYFILPKGLYKINSLQWGQEFFTPGILASIGHTKSCVSLQWGQEFFTPGMVKLRSVEPQGQKDPVASILRFLGTPTHLTKAA